MMVALEPDGADRRLASRRLDRVERLLRELQDRICDRLVGEEKAAGSPLGFQEQLHERERGGWSRPRVLEHGGVFERASVHCTRSAGVRPMGDAPAERFAAVSLSLIVHPCNPHVPTVHLNLRYFETPDDGGRWWFGGGADLTPVYGYEPDVRHWHRTLHDALQPFGDGVYPALKRACDDYYRLPHRGEMRGVGGIFFDRLERLQVLGTGNGETTEAPETGADDPDARFDRCLDLTRAVGESFLPAYLPLVERRRTQPFGERERQFQLVRRGRYVEFNLLYDRGTRYGLEAGVRAESLLSSLPPLAAWRYRLEAEPGSPEALLSERFLQPRDWVAEDPSAEA